MKPSRMKVVYEINPRLDRVEELIRKAGKKFGCVHFIKRSNGELRKMCYRVSVSSPGIAGKPKGSSRRSFNKSHSQITVLDVNKVIRNKKGEAIGRGAWRSVPLENVIMISSGGYRYKIVR